MLEFHLKKRFGTYSLELASKLEGEWLALLAPPGAGKSLTLNLLAGLERPDDGFIHLNGNTLFDSQGGINVPPRKRRMGYLFQDYALFPHLTVAENIAYGLPRRRNRKETIAHWTHIFHLEGSQLAYPHQLSARQKLCAALARSLAADPHMLLLDEPASALDMRSREAMQAELLRLKERLSLPVVLVTRDPTEARLLGDRVALLEEGHVVEMGEREWVFAHPKRQSTARLLGIENVLPALVGAYEGEDGCIVRVEQVPFRMKRNPAFPTGAKTTLCIHATDVRLLLDGKRRPNALRGVITEILPTGHTNRVQIRLNDGGRPTLWAVVDSYVLERHQLLRGSPVALHLPPQKLFLCQ